MHSDDGDAADLDQDKHDRHASVWSGRRSDLMLSTEIGAWAFGCGRDGYLHVNEHEFIVEVVDPAGTELIPVGDDGTQTGEIVLTNLGRAGSPLIRYRTGQIVKLSRKPCKCGRRTAQVAVAAFEPVAHAAAM